MQRLFSPFKSGALQLRNRIVRAPLPIGAAGPGGWTTPELLERYRQWAVGGVGLIISEPIYVHPVGAPGQAGLYDDALVPELARIRSEVASHGALLLPMLSHAGLPAGRLAGFPLAQAREHIVVAAWRARAAGACGIMLDGADDSLLHQLHSPLTNRRSETGRDWLRFVVEIVELLRNWLGPRFLIGYRMVVDELRPDGISLHESRVAAYQLASAGVGLLDVVVGTHPTQPVANFPGWQVPLAAAIKAVVDIPIIANGGLSDAEVAESVLADGSADLIGIGQALVDDPAWPQTIQAANRPETLRGPGGPLGEALAALSAPPRM